MTRGVRTVEFGVTWSKSINCSEFRDFTARPPGFSLPTPEGSMHVGHGCPMMRYCRYFSYDVGSVCIQPNATTLRRPTARPTSSSRAPHDEHKAQSNLRRRSRHAYSKPPNLLRPAVSQRKCNNECSTRHAEAEVADDREPSSTVSQFRGGFAQGATQNP